MVTGAPNGPLNYVLGRPFISSNILKSIVTLNFLDMRNLMPAVFLSDKNVALGTKKD